MLNNIEKEYIYVSSDGSSKDVRALNTEYLINALAKCYRNIFSQTSSEEFNKYVTNIQNIEVEIKQRIKKFREEKENN